jgi:gamma-glutamylcyclotransferase (GGCT)/AIG2-like uncharacterized protein YtfP
MSDLLFVYGTLRRRCRHPMAAWLAGRATFLGEAKTPGQLHDLGRCPGATPAESADAWLFGDLYDLGPKPETWAELDRYENGESPIPVYFERHIVEVTLLDERRGLSPPTRTDTIERTSPAGINPAARQNVDAWLYWFVGPMPTDPPPVRIPSGRYAVNFHDS